jgi:hypothetical protein
MVGEVIDIVLNPLTIDPKNVEERLGVLTLGNDVRYSKVHL